MANLLFTTELIHFSIAFVGGHKNPNGSDRLCSMRRETAKRYNNKYYEEFLARKGRRDVKTPSVIAYFNLVLCRWRLARVVASDLLALAAGRNLTSRGRRPAGVSLSIRAELIGRVEIQRCPCGQY